MAYFGLTTPRTLSPRTFVLLLGMVLLTGGAAAASGADPGHITRLSPDLHELDALGAHARTAKTMLILFEVSVMLALAKILGWASERVKIPGVIGELMAGVIMGPYLLGSLVQIPLHGSWVPLFPAPTTAGEWPVNPIVWIIAQFASIILLFITGLHTDLQQFLKYLKPASLIAVVGLVVPFGLGAGVTFLEPFASLAKAHPEESVLVPALFVGAILAATSIGITARVLGDIGKLDTPEGVTILGAAVLDDVLGIIALAIVIGIHGAQQGTGDGVTVGSISLIAGKALGFWIGLTLLTVLLAKPLEYVLTRMRYAGAMVGIALAIALLGSGAAEGFGLAFIIGAYSVGLGLSRTKMARQLMDELEPIGHFFVPIFFASLGMLVNVQAMFANTSVVVFGLVVTAVAIIGKVVGCGAAALPVGFNSRGAYRIGLGMMPRGEVALIVAGIGLSSQIIGEVVFGVSIMMTLITTIVAPILLVPAFSKGGRGLKVKSQETPEPDRPGLPSASVLPGFVVNLEPALADAFVAHFLSKAEAAGWEPSYEDSNALLLRNQNDAGLVRIDGGQVHIDASDRRQMEFVGFAEKVRDEMIDNAQGITVGTLLAAGPASTPTARPAN